IARALPWALTTAFAVLTVAAFWRGRAIPGRTEPSRSAPIRLRVDDPEAPPTRVSDTGQLALATDGARLAYVSHAPGQEGSVVVRRTDDAHIQRVSLSSREEPFGYVPADMMFSPDGTMVAGFCHSDLYVTPVGGGEPTLLYRGPRDVATKGGAWSRDGII